MYTQISEFFVKHRILKLIIQIYIIKLLVIGLIWLTLNISLHFFIDISKLLSQNSLSLPITYSNFNIVYKGPIPRIVLNNLAINDFLYTKRATIYFKPLSLILFNPKIHTIDFEDSYLQEYSNASKYLISKHEKVVESLVAFGNKNFNIKFSNLNLDDTKISSLDIKNSNSVLSIKGGNEDFYIDTKWAPDKENNVLNITLNKDEYILDLQASYLNTSYQYGNLQISRKDNTNTKNVLTATITSRDKMWHIDDMLMNGEWINGQGNISFSEDKLNASINLNKLDTQLPAHWLLTLLFNTQKNILKSGLLKNKVNINLQITTLKIAKEQINNFAFMANSENQSAIFEKISGNLGEKGNFVIEGNLEDAAFGQGFNGKISLKHNDFNSLRSNLMEQEGLSKQIIETNFQSDIFLNQITTNLSNISFDLGDTKLTGGISYNKYGAQGKWQGLLKIQNYNADDPDSIFKSFTDKINHTLFNSYDANYIVDFATFNKEQEPTNLNIALEKLTFKDNIFDQVHFLLDAKPRQARLNYFNIKQNDLFLLGAANLSFPSFEPTFKVVIFNGKIPELAISNILDFQNLLKTRINLKNLGIDLAMRLDELKISGNSLQNFNLTGKTLHSIIILDKISFNLLGGTVDLNGNILLPDFITSIGYSYNNLNLEPLLADAFILNSMQGVISTNGSINFNGSTLAEMLYNLTLNGKVLGVDLKLPSLGIDQAIDDMVPKFWVPKNDPNTNIPKSQSSTFGNMESSYKMFQGVLSTQNMHFSNDKFNGKATGDLNIYTGKINFDAKFQLPYKINRYGAEPNIALKVGGTLSKPEVSVENSKQAN